MRIPCFSFVHHQNLHTPISMETMKILSVALFLCFCLVPSVFTLPLKPSDHLETFIVHVAKSQKPSAYSSRRSWYSSLLRSLPTNRPSKLLYTYKHAISGFSARITTSQAAHLRRLPGILSILPDAVRHVHTTHTPDFLGLTETFGIWPKSNYADDVIIGVLDTGIWPERPSFSDEGLSPVPSTWKGTCKDAYDFPSSICNRKIIGARAYFRGYEAARGKPMNLSSESQSPRDTEGHGTHTASTAAGSVVTNASLFGYASGEARGMATKARIAVYKICWSMGCYDSDILKAMDQAIYDGVNIISLSVGASGYAPQYDHDSIAIGAFRAVQNGIVVSCSAGNNGPDPYTVVNIAPWILTVGASTVDRDFPAVVVLGDGREFYGVSLFSGEAGIDSKLPVVYAGDCGNRYCYSGSLDSSKVAGKIVLCDRGGNARVSKGSAVKLAGGAGMIMANTEENGEELIADSHLIPATMVGQIAGDQIRSYINSDPSPTAMIVFKGTVIETSPSAPQIASFSSRGPNHLTAEILKPDVIAPGVNILAGWTGYTSPTDLDIDTRRVEFNIISGTSMSCPHVSGLAALLRKAYPEWTPAALKSALMTTSYNLDDNGVTITDLATGYESTLFARGAGHVDPNKALDPGLVYDVGENDYVAFLCAIGYDANRIAVFVGDSTTVDCGAQKVDGPGNLNYPSFSVVFDSNTKAVKYKRVARNVGNKMDAVYLVKVNSPPSVQISVRPNELVFGEETKELSYEVTFTSVLGADERSLGYEGSYGSIEWSDGIHKVRSPIAFVWRAGGNSVSSI